MHPDSRIDRDAAACRWHVRKLLRESFRAAQGDQPTQVHFIQAYARYMRLENVPLDLTVRDALIERVRRQRLPAGHLRIPDPAQRQAQFQFWWDNLWDILTAVYTGTSEFLPARAELDDRAHAAGGHAGMSSFTDAEMAALARTIGLYRRRDAGPGPDLVIDELLLPALIRVELGFQGHSMRYPERPRTDGGDVHESKLLRHCSRALERYQQHTQDIVDRIYRMICRRLSRLADSNPNDPIYARYRTLVSAYNANHPDRPVARLHVPYSVFPTGAASLTGSAAHGHGPV